VQSRYRSSLDIDLTHMQRWPPSRFVTSSLTSCGRIPILNCRGPIHSGGNEKVVSIHSGGVPIHNGGVSIHSRGMRYDPCRTTTTAGHGIPVSPLHDIVSLQSFIMRVNHPFIAPPPACKVDPIAILLRGHCAIYTLPPTPLLYAKHHTMLVMAISCKGQIPVEPCRAQANLASARYCHYYYCMVYGIKKEVGGGAYLAQ